MLSGKERINMILLVGIMCGEYSYADLLSRGCLVPVDTVASDDDEQVFVFTSNALFASPEDRKGI